MSDIYDQLADEMHQVRNARPELFITIHKTEPVPFIEMMNWAATKMTVAFSKFAFEVGQAVSGENYAKANTQ